MAHKRSGKRKIAYCLFVALFLHAVGTMGGIGGREDSPPKVPYRPQWVSVVKKGRLFKYKRKEFSSPRVSGDMVFVGADAGYLYAMKKKTGRKVWRFKTVGAVNSPPAFSGDRVFIGDDKGLLYALSRDRGKEIWRTDLGSEILTEAAVSGDRLFVSTVEGKVAALQTDDGRLLWEREHPLQGSAMTIRGNSPPVVDAEGGRAFRAIVYVGFADGTLWALAAPDGKLIWEKSLRKEGHGFSDIDGAPLIDGDRLLVATFDGGLFAFSRRNGGLLWSREMGSVVRMTSDGKAIYLSGSDGHLYALDRKDGVRIWDAKIGTGALTAPVLYKNIVAVGLSEQTMNFVRADDGRIIARRFARKGVFSDPVVDENRIYYLSNGGRLYSLKFVQ